MYFPEFFVKHGVAVMTVRELFDFITDPSINQNNMDQYLEKVSPPLPCVTNSAVTPHSSFVTACPGDGHRVGADVRAAFQSGPRGRGGEKVLQTGADHGLRAPLTCPPPQVFKKAYIPRTLTEVSHYERDVDVMKESSAVGEHSDSVRTPEEPQCSQSL